jgi:hypothetical protein
MLNGVPLQQAALTHTSVTNGGTLFLEMTAP